MQALQSQEQQLENKIEICLHIVYHHRIITSHYQSAMCVDPCFHSYATNSNKNKESLRHLNLEAINLVVKLKMHLIPLILRVTFYILNIF